MKTVKELYEEYSFEDAVKNLQEEISINLKSSGKTELYIPKAIMQVFVLNPEKSTELFDKMKKIGYKFRTSGSYIAVKFEASLDLINEQQVLLFNPKEKDSNLLSLVDGNIVDKIIRNISSNPTAWIFSKNSYNEYELLGKSDGVQREEIKVRYKDGSDDISICVYIEYINNRKIDKNVFLDLSMDDKVKLHQLITQTFDINAMVESSIVDILQKIK